MLAQTLLHFHQFRVRERLVGSVRIAPGYQPCAYRLSSVQPLVCCSSSPSNGSHSWTGSLYGASGQGSLGGSGLGGFAVSRSIGQPFPIYTTKRASGALHVIDAQRDAVAVPEIKLAQIPVQMSFGAMLVYAPHPALEDREEAFGAIDVGFAARPFLGGVVDTAMSRKASPNAAIGVTFVSHKLAVGVGIPEHRVAESAGLQILNLDRSCPSAALDQGNDGHAVGSAHAALPAELGMQDPLRRASLPSVEGFIDLDGLAFAAERIGAAFVHRQSDAVPEEPAGLEIDPKDASKLICAETFFRRAHEMDRLQPNVQRHMARL